MEKVDKILIGAIVLLALAGIFMQNVPLAPASHANVLPAPVNVQLNSGSLASVTVILPQSTVTAASVTVRGEATK